MKLNRWMPIIFLLLSITTFSQDLISQDSIPAITDTVTVSTAADNIIANQGFSMGSLGRGILGMAVLVLISFMFSSNLVGAITCCI